MALSKGPKGDQIEKIVVGRFTSGAAIQAIGFFLKQDPSLKFEIEYNGVVYPIEVGGKGDLLVVDGDRRRLLTDLEFKAYLTDESAALLKQLKAEQAEAERRKELDRSRDYIAANAIASMEEVSVLKDPRIMELMAGIRYHRKMDIRKMHNGGLSVRKPNVDVTQRLRGIVRRLNEMGFGIQTSNNDSHESLSYPNMVIYFDVNGKLKEVIIAFFERMYGGLNTSKMVSDYLTGGGAKNVLILSSSCGGRDGGGTLSLDYLDRFTITDVNHMDNR